MGLLEESGLLEGVHQIEARDATVDELSLVHDRRYVEAVKRVADEGGGWVDPDTLIMSRSYAVATRASGGVVTALDAIVEGTVQAAFCLVRPPGHHAERAQAMGFCIFNSVAIAAVVARGAYGLERVAIVDFDVHHGNGTQDAFYDDPSVLYISTHQYPFYPGTGAASETGRGDGQGYNVNVPLPAGCGDEAYQRVFEQIVAPALDRFAPQLIIVSAGFDAHFADPLAGEQLSVEGYGRLVSMIASMADRLCHGRMLFALEGGYDLVALPWCVRRTLETLLLLPLTPDPLGTVEAPVPASVGALITEVKRLHRL
jgi:acetoin utilization deacetylase AcuC-like enzyme